MGPIGKHIVDMTFIMDRDKEASVGKEQNTNALIVLSLSSLLSLGFGEDETIFLTS